MTLTVFMVLALTGVGIFIAIASNGKAFPLGALVVALAVFFACWAIKDGGTLFGRAPQKEDSQER